MRASPDQHEHPALSPAAPRSMRPLHRPPGASAPPAPRPAPRRRPAHAASLLRLSVAALLLALLILALSGAALLYFSDWISPGVRALDQELGGATLAEAAALLQEEWQARAIEVVAGDYHWTLAPDQLGLLLDAEATAGLAHAQSRADLAGLWGWLNGEESAAVAPVWGFDAGRAEPTLRALAAQVAVQPINAGVRVVDGRIETTAPAAGRALDVAGALAWLQDNAATVLEGRGMTLPLATLPPAITDVGPLTAQLSQWLRGPVTVQLYDPITDARLAWTIPPQTIAGWLSIGPDPQDARRLDGSLGADKVAAYLNVQAATLPAGAYLELKEATPALLEALASPARTAWLRLYHRARQHIVKDGETLSSIAGDYGIPYPWIEQANAGLEGLRVGQSITIPSPDVLLPLPVVEDKRIVVSLSQQTVWVYQAGALKWQWPASTGMASSPTAPGVYQIQTHDLKAYAANWDLWMPYFMGIYRPAPAVDFMNGFHGFPSRGGTQILWQGNLGRPVTYGCILLSTENAALLYEWAQDGVVVEIKK